MRRLCIWIMLWCALLPLAAAETPVPEKRIAYIVSDLRIPFWEIMSRGIRSKAASLDYNVTLYSSENSLKTELEHTADVTRSKFDGIVLSPISSSSAATVLKLASRAHIPVVIADIGADSSDYVSYISSDNLDGAYQIGRVLTREMKARSWQDGTVGIIAIPQKRDNGKARTAGFMLALREAGIRGSGLRQQSDFSYRETYDYARELIAKDPDIRALWLQGSDRYQGALDAIEDAGRTGEILLICFDAEPEFIDLIPEGVLVGAAMQQPFMMGEQAVSVLDEALRGKAVTKEIQLPILPISKENIEANLPVIRRNVLGMEQQ